jgi:regulator of protease activity HflC (stomatin/prohibitin superfamily)
VSAPDNILKILGVLVTVAFLMLVFWRSIFVTVRPGQVGVMFDLLFGGTQIADVYGEGLVTKFPWNQFFVYEARVQPLNLEMVAYSHDGMAVTVRATLLFKPKRENIPKLHQQVGPFYRDLVILPLVTGAIRQQIGLANSHEMYTVYYDKMQSEVEAQLHAHPLAKVIDFYDFIVTEISLPQAVVAAIERKLAQEQTMFAYSYMIEAQKKEAERLRVEAEGLRGFYEVVGASLTPQLLTWRGIEATVDVARSPNAKVVIMGNGKGQLPLILGGDLGNTPADTSGATAKPTPGKGAASAQVPRLNANNVKEIIADLLEKHDGSPPAPAPRFSGNNPVTHSAAAPESQLGSQDSRARRLQPTAPVVGGNIPSDAFPASRPVNVPQAGGGMGTSPDGRASHSGDPRHVDQAIPLGPGAADNQKAEMHADRTTPVSTPVANAASGQGGAPGTASTRRIDGGLGSLWRRWGSSSAAPQPTPSASKPAAADNLAANQGK